MLNKYLAVAVLCLSFTACKKKEENKPATEAPKTTEPAKTDTTATTPTTPTTEPAKTDTTAAAPAGEIKSVDDYTKLGLDMMDKITAIFAAAGKDCDKLAADLSKFVDENKGKKEAAEAFEKSNPDAKKALDEKAKPQMEKFMAAAGPAMEACKDHKGLQEAMTKMGD